MSITSEITRINTNIASAYAACSGKGAVMPQTQNSANLAATISAISSDDVTVTGKDINFYDYNGALLYSYTFSEATALRELPPLPSHEGLTAQGWNCPIGQVKGCGYNGKRLSVGATYTTSDNTTRLYLLVTKGTKIPSLDIWATLPANTSVAVDWGDGTTATLANTGATEQNVCALKRGYAEVPADTVICVKLTGGSFQLGHSAANSLFGTGYEPALIKAELGSNCTGLLPYVFQNTAIKEIVIPSGITTIPDHAFYGCYDLEAVMLPTGITAIDTYAFGNCYDLSLVSIPATISDIATYAFNNCSNLIRPILPDSLLTIIMNNCFRGCKNIQTIRIPFTVMSFQGGAFMNCSKLYTVDMTAYDDPSNLPVLPNANAFNGTSDFLRFKVANQEMLTAFEAAANWANYAGQFIVG